jgi:hypothetical protein
MFPRIPSIIVLVIVVLFPATGANTAPSEAARSTPNLDEVSDTAGQPAGVKRSLEGRHRLELSFGYWDSGKQRQVPRPDDYVDEMTRVEDLVGAFSYAYWVHDQLATDLTLTALVVEAVSIGGYPGGSESAVVLTSAMFGLRLYPISSARTPLRPYVSAGIGPYMGIQSHRDLNYHSVENVKTLGSFGGYVGGGIDIQMGRHLMAGVHAGYNLMADFREPIGLEDNYEGLVVTAGLSVLLGKGSER